MYFREDDAVHQRRPQKDASSDGFHVKKGPPAGGVRREDALGSRQHQCSDPQAVPLLDGGVESRAPALSLEWREYGSGRMLLDLSLPTVTAAWFVNALGLPQK